MGLDEGAEVGEREGRNARVYVGMFVSRAAGCWALLLHEKRVGVTHKRSLAVRLAACQLSARITPILHRLLPCWPVLQWC